MGSIVRLAGPVAQRRQLADWLGGILKSNADPAFIYEVRRPRFVQVNDAALAFFGYDRAAFSDLTPAAVLSSEFLERALGAPFPEAPGKTFKFVRADSTLIEARAVVAPVAIGRVQLRIVGLFPVELSNK